MIPTCLIASFYLITVHINSLREPPRSTNFDTTQLRSYRLFAPRKTTMNNGFECINTVRGT